MTIDNYSEIFKRVEKCFCEVFGRHYENSISAETSMDDIVEWDSLNYIDFVCELEDEFDIEFSETESAQMFQIQHILRIIDSIVHHKPHDDVKHAYAQMQLILQHAESDCTQIIILSGSSTREGFVPLNEMQDFASTAFDKAIRVYNISVSGLVIAEMLQIIEALQNVKNLRYVIGFSPIILFGCGMNEFNRSCQFERFSTPSPLMLSVLSEYGYQKTSSVSSQSIEQWCHRFLANRSLEELRYSPYKYPTLKPWDAEKLADEESILRYYNNAPLNFTQSKLINAHLLDQIFTLTTQFQQKLIFINLTLHSETLKFLEELGQLVSQTKAFIREHVEKGHLIFIDGVENAEITDEDYRDPGHIFVKQEQYTQQTLLALELSIRNMEEK